MLQFHLTTEPEYLFQLRLRDVVGPHDLVADEAISEVEVLAATA
jgi:hypothetical protein